MWKPSINMWNVESLYEPLIYIETRLNSYGKMNEMRQQNQLCDVSLKTRGYDQEMPVHRNVLVATIPYFKTLFIDESKPGPKDQPAVVLVPRMDQTTLQSLIHFAYVGQLWIDMKNMGKLMVAAHALQLRGIQEACVAYILLRLNVHNVFGLRSAAESIAASDLVRAADKFIVDNIAALSRKSDFLNLGTAAILNICKQDVGMVKTNQLFVAVMRWIKHDEVSRSKLIAPILRNIRLHRVTRNFLMNQVRMDRLVSESPECRSLVEDALSQCLIQTQQENLDLCVIFIAQLILVVIGLFIAAQIEFMTRATNTATNTRSALETRKIYAIDVQNRVNIIDPSVPNIRAVDCPECRDVAVHQGKMYAFRKTCDKCTYYSSFYTTFDTKTEAWAKWSEMTTIHNHRSTSPSISECIFFPNESTKAIYCYSPATNILTNVAPMITSRSNFAIVVLDGFLYAIGGMSSDQRALTYVEKYNATTKAWTSVTPMSEERQSPEAAVLSGKLYVCGGQNTERSELQSAEMFDPETNQWTSIAPMHEKRTQFGLLSSSDTLMAIDTSFEVYSPHTNLWVKGAPLTNLNIRQAFLLEA